MRLDIVCIHIVRIRFYLVISAPPGGHLQVCSRQGSPEDSRWSAAVRAHLRTSEPCQVVYSEARTGNKMIPSSTSDQLVRFVSFLICFY